MSEAKAPLPAYCRLTAGGDLLLELRAKPRSAKRGPLRVQGTSLLWGLNAPPVDGEANRELIDQLAEYLEVRKSDVSIERGGSSKAKLVRITRPDLDFVIRKFEGFS